MKILYVAGREAAYSRSRIVLNALRQNGFEVIECLPPDKAFKHYPGLLLKTLLNAPRCDAVVVGFYGQLLAPLVRLLTWKPILFDMYITTYDTMVFDREKAAPGTLKARIYGLSDWLSYKMTGLSILDSHHVIGHFGRTIHTETSKFRRLFLAVDDSVIKPGPTRPADDEFLVHFHGEYIPFHGVRHILRAAKLLEPHGVRFQIVGKGLTFEEDMQLARELGLPHVKFLDPVPYAKLAELMAKADVCLGIFGDNERAKLVLTNKVVEAIGVGKPLITSRNQPVQELLKDGESVLLVKSADPEGLAEAILRLKDDEALRTRIAANGHAVFLQQCATDTFGKRFTAILHEVLGKRRAAE